MEISPRRSFCIVSRLKSSHAGVALRNEKVHPFSLLVLKHMLFEDRVPHRMTIYISLWIAARFFFFPFSLVGGKYGQIIMGTQNFFLIGTQNFFVVSRS